VSYRIAVHKRQWWVGTFGVARAAWTDRVLARLGFSRRAKVGAVPVRLSDDGRGLFAGKYVTPVQQKLQQVRQQACKTQIPPYGLTLRRRPQFQLPPNHGAPFRLPHCDFYIAHHGSNSAAVTPREPKSTKMGDAHRGW